MAAGRPAPLARSRPLAFRFFARLLQRGIACAAAVAVLVALLAQTELACAQTASEYKLGAQDKVRLKVFEWRSTINAVFEWTSLNAEFTVGASGSLSLPILGEVPAAGLTTSELARAIGENLRTRIGLSEAPNVAVEVVQYRPFYIVGAVNKPGEYPYRPDLTVLQALSIAGGLLGSGESGMRLSREIIAGQGESQASESEANNLLARKARLEAELGNAESITFPPELERRSDDPAVATVMRQEVAIFESRRNALKTEIQALSQLKEFLTKGVESLQAQLEAQKNERDLTKKELEGVASLVSRGLAASPRQLDLERTMSRMEGDRLRMETELLRTRQDISRADLSMIEARNKMANAASEGLRETQTKLEQSMVKMATADRLLYDSQVTYPRLLASRRQDSKIQPVYRIVRRQADGQTKETPATDSSILAPGDTLKVEIPLPDSIAEPPKRAPNLSQ
jgi:protein involved in polysaccharide export with SLBB domain